MCDLLINLLFAIGGAVIGAGLGVGGTVIYGNWRSRKDRDQHNEDMKETTDTVKETHIDVKTVLRLVSLIHTGETEKMAEMAPDRDREEIAEALAEVVGEASNTVFGTSFVFEKGTFVAPILPVIKSVMSYDPVQEATDSVTPLAEGETPEAGTVIRRWPPKWWRKKRQG